RAVQAAEDLQQRGLAVPGRPLDGQPFAVLDHPVDPAQRGYLLPAFGVVLGHSGELVHVVSLRSLRRPWTARPRDAAVRPASRRRSGRSGRPPRPGRPTWLSASWSP